ncbi:hypothetical protein CsSME_00017186 [Camellia sinensis var. sinensis]
MEAFTRLLGRAVAEGLLEGFSVGSLGRGVVGVSHLLYADDALVFCEPRAEQLGYLRCVLLCFETVSGLRVNLSKSELIPVGEVDRVPMLAAILGCKVSALPVSYLGLPLGATFKSQGVWNGVVERVQRRLAGWKKQYLSKGGRFTLIQSVLSSIPTYFMSVQKLQRDFLWRSGGEVFRYYLVGWARICSPKDAGGLGVRSLLWQRVIAAKFGVDSRDWRTRKVTRFHGRGLWRGIWFWRDEFWDRVHFRVGNGKRVRFWRDKWCGEVLLEDRFPLIFGIAADPEVTMANCFGNGEVVDWEATQLEEILGFVHGLGPVGRGEDRVVWTVLGTKGVFTVSSFYRSLVGGATTLFPWRSIWVPGVPSKVVFFLWIAALGRNLTIDNLVHRGHVLVNRYCMCCMDAESVDHLFLHCDVASHLWGLVCSLFGVVWVQPQGVLEMLWSWEGARVGRRRQRIWFVVPFCLMWLVWLERNRRTFLDIT